MGGDDGSLGFLIARGAAECLPSSHAALFVRKCKYIHSDGPRGQRSTSQSWGCGLDAEPTYQVPWAKQGTAAAQGLVSNHPLSLQIRKRCSARG